MRHPGVLVVAAIVACLATAAGAEDLVRLGNLKFAHYGRYPT